MTGRRIVVAGREPLARAGRGRTLRTSTLGQALLVALPVIAIVVVWWAVTATLDRARVFPPPDLVGAELMRIFEDEGILGSTYGHIGATVFRLVAAFGVSMVIGSAVGIVAGRIPIVFDFLDNIVWVFMAVPSIVWVFIFAVAIGISEVVPIAAVSALLTPMILVTVAEGTKSVPGETMEMARSYKATRAQMVLDVFLPHLVPYLVSSARMAFALAVKLIVIAEVVGLSSGIGYEVKYWYDRLFMAPIVAWGLVMVAIGLVVDYGVFAPLERWASRWKGKTVLDTATKRVAQ
jgi:NitT/TauT family transport system permease protein